LEPKRILRGEVGDSLYDENLLNFDGESDDDSSSEEEEEEKVF